MLKSSCFLPTMILPRLCRGGVRVRVRGRGRGLRGLRGLRGRVRGRGLLGRGLRDHRCPTTVCGFRRERLELKKD